MSSKGTNWERVDGRLVWISSGMVGEVWGVNSANEIFTRDGISKKPSGTGWFKQNGKLKQLSALKNQVWGVDGNGTIWSRPMTCHPGPEPSACM